MPERIINGYLKDHNFKFTLYGFEDNLNKTMFVTVVAVYILKLKVRYGAI